MCDTDFGDRQLWGQAPDPVLIPRAPFVQAAGEGEAVCTLGLSELTVSGRGWAMGDPWSQPAGQAQPPSVLRVRVMDAFFQNHQPPFQGRLPRGTQGGGLYTGLPLGC